MQNSTDLIQEKNGLIEMLADKFRYQINNG